MPPCTGTFGAVKAPKRVTVEATTSDKKAVYSLTVVVLPRDADAVVFEHFVFTRTALENGSAAWDLDPARIYKLALVADKAVTLATTIDLSGKQIFDSSCGSAAPGLVGLWTLPTRKVAP
jgi:hypothetical protein